MNDTKIDVRIINWIAEDIVKVTLRMLYSPTTIKQTRNLHHFVLEMHKKKIVVVYPINGSPRADGLKYASRKNHTDYYFWTKCQVQGAPIATVLVFFLSIQTANALTVTLQTNTEKSLNDQVSHKLSLCPFAHTKKSDVENVSYQ